MDFDQLLSMLMAPGQVPPGGITVLKSKKINEGGETFKKFKQFTLEYIQKKDHVKRSDPTMKQIAKATSLEQIEAYLRNLDYCGDCLLHLYKSFISDNTESNGCSMDNSIDG